MERLKKSRTIIRTAFTRNLGLLNAELSRESPDAQELQVCLAMISEKHSELENIHQKIVEIMFDGDASEEQRRKSKPPTIIKSNIIKPGRQ